MASNEQGTSLDEPAWHIHTSSGWPVQTIEISPSGKAPKQYGPAAYRFSGASLTLCVILPRRGWTLLRRTKDYAYLIPPAGQAGPPFKISIAVPTDEQCLEMARRSYAAGESWVHQLDEWPAEYVHERNYDSVEVRLDSVTGEIISLPPINKSPPKSQLFIGEWGAWFKGVTAVNGVFVMGLLSPDLLPSTPATALFADDIKIETASSLFEGAAQSIELTVYERNATARRRCIEHYGPNCQACGLNYEKNMAPSALG